MAATVLLTHGTVETAPIQPIELGWFAVLADSHARQGIELIDWIIIDVLTGNYRSLAVAAHCL